jgi:hypothetical protein
MDQTSFTPTCDVVSCCAMPSASLSVVLISFARRLTHPARTHVGMGVLRCSRLPLRQLKIVFRSKPAHCSAALPASVESILGRGKLRSSYIYECRIYEHSMHHAHHAALLHNQRSGLGQAPAQLATTVAQRVGCARLSSATRGGPRALALPASEHAVTGMRLVDRQRGCC